MSPSYENLLHDFAIHVGIDPDSLLRAQGMLIDGLAIGFQHDGEEGQGDLLYFSSLGTPHASQLDRIARKLLEANHFCIGTDGCTLGVQAETGAVTLCGRKTLKIMDAEYLAMLLDAFVDTANYWKQVVEGVLDSSTSIAIEPRAMPFDQFV